MRGAPSEVVTVQVRTAQRDAVNVNVAVSTAGAMIDHLIGSLPLSYLTNASRTRTTTTLKFFDRLSLIDISITRKIHLDNAALTLHP